MVEREILLGYHITPPFYYSLHMVHCWLQTDTVHANLYWHINMHVYNKTNKNEEIYTYKDGRHEENYWSISCWNMPQLISTQNALSYTGGIYTGLQVISQREEPFFNRLIESQIVEIDWFNW